MADTSPALDNLPGLDNPQTERQTAAVLRTGTDNRPITALPTTLEGGQNSLAICLAISGDKSRIIANRNEPMAIKADDQQNACIARESLDFPGKTELRQAGVEPTTFGFGGQRSIQLSY